VKKHPISPKGEAKAHGRIGRVQLKKHGPARLVCGSNTQEPVESHRSLSRVILPYSLVWKEFVQQTQRDARDGQL
jgi:hypothetical protein